ncbi:hypothetical protein [Vulcanisaeta thermophila]|uniref:hypothetical protein n=1 Tax=Vulcanisaeta thermophila TaxID=867917 RepID=UPI001EE39E4C|nr:hypothetical protein [Vulcanisaeta thermophila]
MVFPVLVLLNVAAWVYFWLRPSILGFALISTMLAIFFTYVFIGVVPVEIMEENDYDPRVVRSMGIAILVGLIIVYVLYFYVGGILLTFIKPPQLLLVDMVLLLFIVPLTPYVVLLIMIPPIIGYFIRGKWASLRRHVPFWGVYLGVLAAVFTLLMPILYFRVIFVGSSLINTFIAGGVLLILSIIPLMTRGIKSEGLLLLANRVVALILVLMGIALWFIAAGGMGWGSVLSIIAGAYLYDWKPKYPGKNI